MSYDNAYEVVDEISKSLLSMRGIDFIFDSVKLLYYKCHRINFRRGGSYMKCPDYAVTDELNYGEIKWNSKRV